jgi:hypothetical protein
VDVDALTRGTPQEAVAIPGLGRDLLEGMEFGNSPAFETWLLIERRRLLGAAEAPSTKLRSIAWRRERRPRPSGLPRAWWS